MKKMMRMIMSLRKREEVKCLHLLRVKVKKKPSSPFKLKKNKIKKRKNQKKKRTVWQKK